MTSNSGFYIKPTVLESSSFEDDIYEIEEDNVDFDNQGYLYEVPYTSSSIDRSSIGSIPWADDAIKINKLEWEKVEKMLSGLEPLPAAKDDLTKEILDWQKKFPQLLAKNTNETKALRSDTLDLESFPSLELSYDEDLTEDKITPTRDSLKLSQSTSKSSEGDISNMCQLMTNFTLKTVPFKLGQREANRAHINKRKISSSTSSYSIRSPPTPIQQTASITTSNRFRMPPILSVIDSRNKFRNLGQNKNPSFVQLTQIQQTKSAAITQEQKTRARFHTGHRSAWHVPFAANRFSNNKNSIILPSISTTHQVIQRYSSQPSTTSPTFISGNSGKLIKTNNNLIGFTTNASTQTNSSNTSGRSISAAVKYPRVTSFNALYLPYRASKFHPFN